MKKNLSLILLVSVIFISAIHSQVIDEFILEDINNESISLDDIKGDRLTIIDFWATWCKPCTKAMPKLNEIFHEYKDSGLSVIGISCDGPRSISKVSAVVHHLDIDYPILKDINCEVMNAYQYQVFPTLLLLNADSEVIYVHEGFSSGDEVEIRETIEQYLK